MDILDKKVINTKFAKLVAYCQETGSQLVSFMDSNCHNGALWGNDVNDVNPRGRVFGDYIIKNNLNVLNKGDEITYARRDVATQIDVCLASSKLGDLVNRRTEQWNTGEPLPWQAAEFLAWKGAEFIYSAWKMAEFPLLMHF